MKRVLILALILSFSMTMLAREPLTFEQRVKAQEAIEKVYYNHRIWPKENPGPKPPFEKMVSKETIEAKAADYLKKSAALEKYWYRPITGEQLQAEMDRIAKGTKDPATLNELFEALNNDPYLIAECLARPVLADRLIRNWYANDERFHKETREKAEEALKHLTPENFCSYPEGQYSKMTYRLENVENEEREMLDPEDHSIGLDEKEFEKMYSEIPEEGKISGVIEKSDCFVILHTVEKYEGEITVEGITFMKVSAEEWLRSQKEQRILLETIGSRAMFLSPLKENWCSERWDNGILDDVPDPRCYHTAIWTGTEMIIWGGLSGNYLNSGGMYNPSTDTWISTSTGANCPSPRGYHTAIWTGSEMIIWGGFNGYDYFSSGGKYSVSSDTWTSTSDYGNCPEERSMHCAVWTGNQMIIWGGANYNGTYYENLDSGGKYNPSLNTWVPTSILGDCPGGTRCFSAVWTGSEMIIWGGYPYTNIGGRYNPTDDTWAATSIGNNCPTGRSLHTAIWTGTEMIVWGGEWYSDNVYHYENSGGRYNPTTDSWAETSLGANCPIGRECHSAVWTGTEMLVWGGVYIEANTSIYLNTGGSYNPTADQWGEIPIVGNTPSPRSLHSSIWTDSEMIILGGKCDNNQAFNDGGRYRPSDGTWIITSGCLSYLNPRSYHTSIWTGAEMIIWGGISSDYNSSY